MLNREKKWYQILTKGDIILVISIFILSFLSLLVVSNFKTKGNTVIIEADNHYSKKFKLSENRDVTVKGPVGITVISIKNNRVRVTHSDCKGQICVNTGAINKTGEIIVCAPNKIVVRIAGKKENHFHEITE